MVNMDNSNIPILPALPPDTFRFGKRPVSVGQVHSFQSWDYLCAPANDIPAEHRVNGQGSRYTRFGPGFYRKNKYKIMAQYDRPSTSAKTASAAKTNLRKQRLSQLSNPSGYNVINGTELAGREIKSEPHRKVYLADRVKKSLQREGDIALRDSMNRFYYTSTKNLQRTNILKREGLFEPKKSSLLGSGRNDLESSGASDAFEKSVYIRNLNTNERSNNRQIIPSVTKSSTKGPTKGHWVAPVAKISCAEADEVRNLPS